MKNLVFYYFFLKKIDASKIESSLNNGQQRVVKRRSKRDSPIYVPPTSFLTPSTSFQAPCSSLC